ncbi:MAG: hypothetical protein JXK94_15265 [Deltaproteobacteria bacterium]|nr:hypothetical protein [Deltaproteobacteria bacterium]
MENSGAFYWERHPEAEALFLHFLDDYKRNNGFLADFEKKLISRTSSRMLDFVDHILVRDSKEIRDRLGNLGFGRKEEAEAVAWSHPGALLPKVILVDSSAGQHPGAALRVESIESFLRANELKADIEGPPLSPFRRGLISEEKQTVLWVVERRGTSGFAPISPDDEYPQDYARGMASWKNLLREENDDQVFSDMARVAGGLVAKLGVGLAAHIVCLCERDYWLSRNFAGRAQKQRQDALGLGWANHDHHTFRSSRRNFSKLINLFLQLGFHKRERFYAGRDAGWGAQVMEHSEAGLALFLDVDLTPEEVNVDFSKEELKEQDSLGTVGLWCALHGDSILKAGMHHLAARFEFEQLLEDMAGHEVNFMAPFSNFPYLKQAFSVAEMWQVSPTRAQRLLQAKLISNEQAAKFLERGSVGSHLENIERREGYKGFNKKNVSAIIQETDPRKS